MPPFGTSFQKRTTRACNVSTLIQEISRKVDNNSRGGVIFISRGVPKQRGERQRNTARCIACMAPLAVHLMNFTLPLCRVTLALDFNTEDTWLGNKARPSLGNVIFAPLCRILLREDFQRQCTFEHLQRLLLKVFPFLFFFLLEERN